MSTIAIGGKRTFPDMNKKTQAALHARDTIPVRDDYWWIEFKFVTFFQINNIF